ncbi:MAG: sigma-54-dependent Fis family transcriptional regulator, partial [Candidatus Dadabacteria bacterium]
MSRILIVDDDRPFAATLRTTLELEGHEAEEAHTAAEAEARLRDAARGFDLALLDLRLPDRDGLDLLRRALALRPDLPVVILTAYGSVQTAVEAMRAGAFDFLLKPFPRERLLGTVERALERGRLVRENRALRRQVEAAEPGDLTGRSPRFLEVLELARRAAPTDATVLLLGETGTGKERLARFLHRHSRRADRPLLTVNCAALADTLLESQLFGHRKGAFTGADEARKGLFEEADGGTIFLDEIGDVSASLQA